MFYGMHFLQFVYLHRSKFIISVRHDSLLALYLQKFDRVDKSLIVAKKKLRMHALKLGVEIMIYRARYTK